MAQVFKNVIVRKHFGRYKDGCSKMTKPDDYVFFPHVFIWYTQGEVYSIMANLYKSHLSNQKKLSEAHAQVHIYLLYWGNF